MENDLIADPVGPSDVKIDLVDNNDEAEADASELVPPRKVL
jgi:hypothetical protein